ncbi:NUDIX domain-containing protein [Apibacter muscae]|uniref:NUDIX hydrolase n=1 Tax=Apibacter muscae TaxID=2509004 RepID=UPI0011AD8ACC|nr:NUDIX domain-containing protein [Apibacter muscae]TWP23265.1 NUDIX domain-containing protein [Apibacter muscae]
MYKISVNEKFLSIGKKKVKGAINLPYSPTSFQTSFELLYNSKEVRYVNIFSKNKKKTWAKFQEFALPIYAAGGIVHNQLNEFLFIKRNGIWDLPKGHVEKGESFEETALREVEEECGIKNLELKEFLKTTYHVYYSKDQYYLKVVQWFSLFYMENKSPKPQIEEGIEMVKFASKKEVSTFMKNTYRTIYGLCNKYILK